MYKLKKWAIGFVTVAMLAGLLMVPVQAASPAVGVIKNVNGEITATLTSDLIQNQSLPTFAGDSMEPNRDDQWITVTINGKSYTTLTPSDVQWTIVLPTGDELADGAYPLRIHAMDSSGDVGLDFSDMFVIDTVAPPAPTMTSNDTFNTPTPVLFGTAEAGSTVLLTIGGQAYMTVADAAGTWSLTVPSPLALGIYTAVVYVKDTAGNQSSSITHSITIRAASMNATLTGISIGSWGMTPAFASNIFKYKVDVKNGTKSVEIRPIGIPAGAYVTVNGVTVPGGRSVSVALRSGVLNKLAIEVTAEDGVTKKSYTVNVNRPAIRAYAKGIGGGKFNPDAPVTRQELAYMLDQLFSSGSGPRMGSMFMDLCMDNWANPAIESVAKKGIMIGYNGMHFGMHKPITRGQLAVIVSRLKKLPTEPKVVLADTIGSKNQKVFAGVVEAGYMTANEDGMFRPDGIVTRAEAIVLLNKLSNREPLDGGYVQRWSDVSTTHFAYEAIQNATISR